MLRLPLIFLITFCYAVINYLPAQQLSCQTYTVQDGLVANPVRRIFQDSKGFIWIATWEGLSKFDGYKFTSFSTENGLSHNLINDLYETNDGKLLIAENGGSVDVMMPDGSLRKNVFDKAIINQFFQTKTGKVVAVTDTNGVYELVNDNFLKPTQQISANTFTTIAQINDSLFVAATDELPSLFQIFSDQYNSVVTIKNKDFYINCLFKDSKKRLWAGTNRGLKLAVPVNDDIRSCQLTSLYHPFNIAALEEGFINDILEDADGNFWIATKQALVKIQANGATQLFTEKNGLASSSVDCLFEDREKNIWIGTEHGITKLTNKINFEIYKKGDGLASNKIMDVLPVSPDHLLVFSERSCQSFNLSRNSFSYPAFSGKNFRAYDPNSAGMLLMQLKAGLARYDPGENRIIAASSCLSDSFPWWAVMDKLGNIFLSFRDSLKICVGKNVLAVSPWKNTIDALLPDKKGYLWVGTWNNGLYRLQYSLSPNNIQFSIKKFAPRFASNNIRSLFEDSKGNVWVGTRYDGVFRFSEQPNGEYAVKHIRKQQGLTSDWIRSFAEDSEGNIWIGSALGIDKLILTDDNYRIINFSYLNNFFAAVYSIVPAPDKTIWCATSNGLLHFSDNRLEEILPPPVYITTASLGSLKEKIDGLRAGNSVYLKYSQNDALFEFSAPSFINEKRIKYSYRLKGDADTTWNTPANTHSVSYSSLQPGKYNFEVRTLGWNNQPGTITSFDFIISSPFWRTWWFITICFLIFGSLLFALYKYRINQLLKLQQVRNNIAIDLHDEIGSTLTNINILSEICRTNLERPNEAKRFLQKISEEVTSSSQALDDIIWSVNSHNDSLNETLGRMRRYGAELFESTSIKCQLDFETSTATVLQMEKRKDIYLVYKELLNNILKHAHANHVSATVRLKKNYVHLVVTDNGKGFDPDKPTHRNGLRNLKARLNRWKGEIKIISGENGTTADIVFPLEG